ncbi:MAG: GDP-mannose 4,6-dehydratase, partial [bacterium]
MSIKGKIVIPGGCGFIGTNFVRRIVERVGELEIVVFDKLTYSGDFGNIKELVEKKKVRFVRGDIAELESVKKYFAGADYIVNFAAETHVDRSLKEPYPFVMTNFVGVANILEFVRENPVTRFLHISTDEVYGPTNENNIAKEDSPLRPTTPYASTKASADMLCISYARAFELDIIIARPT